MCVKSALTVSLRLVLAQSHNNVPGLLGLASEIVLEDTLRAGSVASLSVEGRPGVMRNHAVTTTERVLHGAPDVVFRRGLDVPDIAGVTREVAAFQCPSNSIFVANRAASRVNEPGTLLEVLQEFVVHETPGSLVKRAVDGDDIALRDQLLQILDTDSTHRLGSSCGKRGIVVV